MGSIVVRVQAPVPSRGFIRILCKLLRRICKKGSVREVFALGVYRWFGGYYKGRFQGFLCGLGFRVVG